MAATGDNVLVNAHAPGAVQTNLLSHIVGPGGQLEQVVGPTIRAAIWGLMCRVVWHPREASLTQVFTAVAEAVTQGGVSGKYFQSVAREQSPDPHCANHALQAALWEATERLIADVPGAS